MQRKTLNDRKQLECGEVWRGNSGLDIDITTPGTEVSLYSQACCKCSGGGDIYYLSLCNWGLLTRIAIADVMGHGPAVADTGAWMCSSIKDKMNSLHGNEILTDLNSAAVDHGYAALATAAVISWDHEDKELHYSYAGHHPAFLLRTSDTRWNSLDLLEPLTAANLPLGAGEEHHYDQSTIKLTADDMLFVFTDGVTEAENNRGERYGDSKLLALLNNNLRESPASIKAKLLADLYKFVGHEFSHDDMTFMVVRVS